MTEAREESKRIYHEFRKFYDKHPLYNSRSNDDIFLDYAEQCGGRELISAEQLELWLDSLKGKLAVMSETPAEALAKFMAENPAYACEANGRMLVQHLRQHGQPIILQKIKEAFAEIKNQLAFNQEVADERARTLEAKEREELARYISKTYGRTTATQDLKYRELMRTSTQYLRDRAAEIREKTRLTSMSKNEVKAEIGAIRKTETYRFDVLPDTVTAEYIKHAKPEELSSLIQHYGADALNARLGYVKPELDALVRTVRLPLATR
jgi:hypothetical protein